MQPSELKELRTICGMSQAKFASALGMSRVTVSNMERGSAPIEKRTGLAAQYLAARMIVFQRLSDEPTYQRGLEITAAGRAASLLDGIFDLPIHDLLYLLAGSRSLAPSVRPLKEN